MEVHRAQQRLGVLARQFTKPSGDSDTPQLALRVRDGEGDCRAWAGGPPRLAADRLVVNGPPAVAALAPRAVHQLGFLCSYCCGMCTAGLRCAPDHPLCQARCPRHPLCQAGRRGGAHCRRQGGSAPGGCAAERRHHAGRVITHDPAAATGTQHSPQPERLQHQQWQHWGRREPASLRPPHGRPSGRHLPLCPAPAGSASAGARPRGAPQGPIPATRHRYLAARGEDADVSCTTPPSSHARPASTAIAAACRCRFLRRRMGGLLTWRSLACGQVGGWAGGQMGSCNMPHPRHSAAVQHLNATAVHCHVLPPFV